MVRRIGCVFSIVLLAFGAVNATFPKASADGELKKYVFEEIHMATKFRLVLFAADEAVAKMAAKEAFASIAELDRMMTDYKEDSELMQLCAKSGGPPTKVSEDLFKVFTQAQEVARKTEGAYDISISPVVKLWRRARRSRELPPTEQLKKAMALVDYRQIVLNANDRTVQLLIRGMLLDLGSIAKGYAGDAALEVLAKHGITRALVVCGGDVVAGDPPPGEKGWRVGIAPLKNPDAEPSHYLSIANAGVSTAGDAEQAAVIDGKRYSHIVDPKTGYGLQGRRSVTIVSRRGLVADAWDTAICVLGMEKGLAMIESQEALAGLMTFETDEGVVTRVSKRMEPYLVKE
jgi:thiamine biosynthesis lipoprotein